MAVLTADLVAGRTARGASRTALQVLNAEVMYSGSFQALAGPNAASGSGYQQALQGVAGEIQLPGWAPYQVTGDTTASPPPELEIGLEDHILEGVTVTGVAAISDIGQPVYKNNDNDLTLTRPTRGQPCGMVIDWYSGTTCDVYIFGLGTLLAIGLAGNGQEIWHLGYFQVDTIVNGNLVASRPMPYHGAFLEWWAEVDVALTASGDSTILNLEIAGTDVTAGTLTLTGGTHTKGTRVAAAAITVDGNEVFHEGETLDIEAASTTDFAGGAVNVYALVQRHFGV